MLLFRNMARVFVLDKVTDFLLLLGKLVVVGGVACASFYFFSGRIHSLNPDLQLNYYFVPIILITLGAYFIADIFFGVYGNFLRLICEKNVPIYHFRNGRGYTFSMLFGRHRKERRQC